MKNFKILFLVGLVIISGCKRKRIVQERLCSRVDLEQITSLIPKTSDDIYLLCDQIKELLDQAFVKIDQIPAEKRSYANTVLIYEQAYFQFFTQQQVLKVLANLSEDSGIQTAANVVLLELDEYARAMLLRNVTLYQALDEYEKYGKDPYRHIKPVTFFLESSFQEFARQGMQLSVEKRADLLQLEKDINNLSGRFCSNVFHDRRYLIVGVDQVAGISEQFLAGLSKDDQGSYILPIDHATFEMVMQKCQNAKTRKQYFLLYKQIGYPLNQTVFQDLQEKRQEYCNLLGFNNFANYQLSFNMMQNFKKADSFLWNMVKDLQSYDDAEFAAMMRYLPDSVVLNSDKKIEPWDQKFIKHAYEKKHFKIDDEIVANYFPLDHVLPTMLTQLSKFFHIEFEIQQVHDLWASNLICYRVRSMKHQAILGYLFFDLYARKTKRDDGMYEITMIPAIRDDCSLPCVGASVIVANFKPCTKDYYDQDKVDQDPKDQDPQDQDPVVLLNFSEVKSLFYQMGYALHSIFGATRFTKFSGTQTVYDFKEVPSKVLKHWLLQPSVLNKLSQHVDTSQPLSRDMIEQLIAREKFGRAGSALQQAFLGLVALNLCDHEKNVHKLIEKLHKKVFRHVAYEPEDHFECSFLSCADNQHAALYYGNILSDVIAADIFAEIKKHGIFNHEIGMRYVTEVLSPGGSRNSYEMIKRFLGHPFYRKSFLEELEH